MEGRLGSQSQHLSPSKCHVICGKAGTPGLFAMVAEAAWLGDPSHPSLKGNSGSNCDTNTNTDTFHTSSFAPSLTHTLSLTVTFFMPL